ncbi:ABC transporter permease [Kurthia senegalensis]|uniref:ABC transporter permease n=1 Tax=Kurthia senegalensis TaxID=1033740 RepID=UPI0002890209|nr:ABC transporter permease [Kurthia senegalensis]
MFTAIFGSVEQGIIYAIMALGVYITFRVLDFPDLTVDGSFVTGAATAATMITFGYNPFLATFCALLAGFVAGSITGILHTKARINELLAGILMMIALYSINLRIMGLTTETSVGRPTIPLSNADTVFTKLNDFWSNLSIDAALNNMLSAIGVESVPRTWGILVVMFIVTFAIKFLVDWFLKTEIGLALRATGDNAKMIRSFSANTDAVKIFGLGLSNALVATSGALIAQYSKFADVGMGIGMIVIGLASVIIGEAIFGTKTVVRTTLAVVFGAIVYRIVLALALKIEFLDTGDMKLITAVIVIIALIVPYMVNKYKDKKRRMKRREQLLERVEKEVKGEEPVA